MGDRKIFVEVSNYEDAIITNPDDIDIIIYDKTGKIKILKRCTIQALYSRLMELWREHEFLIILGFPIEMFTPVSGQMRYGWKIINPELISCSIAQMDTGLTESDEEWRSR